LRKSKRARRVRLAVYCDGSVVVTSPMHVRQSFVDQFIAEKRQWILDKVSHFNTIDRKMVRPFSKADYTTHKKEALKLAEERVAFYNAKYNYSVNRIGVRNQKTRWGSCSSKRNLSFNYRILFLSPQLRDYVIVHEICHLKEMNHSKKFWDLVAHTFPSYKVMRRELMKNGLTM